MPSSTKAKSKSSKSHRSDDKQSTVIFTPPSTTYSNSSARTGPQAAPPSVPSNYPYNVRAYCQQPAALDGPLYGRVQELPTNPNGVTADRVAAYVDQAGRIASSFDQSFHTGGRGSNK